MSTRSSKKASKHNEEIRSNRSIAAQSDRVKTKEKVKPLKKGHCQMCTRPDTKKMVQCDGCKRWNHFNCVGVTQAIEDHTWYCPVCVKAAQDATHPKATPDNVKPTPEKPKSSCSIQGSSKSKKSQMMSRLKQLEEEQALIARERQILQEKNQLLQEIADESSEEEAGGGGENVDGNEAVDKVKKWLDRQRSKDHDAGGDEHRKKDSVQRSSGTNRVPHTQAPNDSFWQKDSFAPEPSMHSNKSVVSNAHNDGILTPSQLAARQAVSKELPQFNGNPCEWPMFIASYNNSTKMCGYTSEENMMRLQKSLRGRAYDAVRSRLLHPSNTTRVIATLRMLYGRPEMIVQSIIDSIREMPEPRSDKLITLIEFALEVENLVATIDACEMEEYFYNVALLNELVEKLPSAQKLDWAKYRQGIPTVRLTDFSNWLYNLAEAASAVIPNQYVGSQGNASRRNRKGEGFINIHCENCSSSLKEQSSHSGSNLEYNANAAVALSCLVCQGECPSLEKCNTFVALDIDQRWSAIREHRICRRCLKRHKGLCKGEVCNEPGCNYRHHPMLHDSKQAKLTKTTDKKTDHPCNTHRANSSDVLFRIVPVILYGAEKQVETYAFFDDGSSLTMMDEELAAELNLHGITDPLCLTWTANTCRYEDASQRVDLQISGVGKGHKRFKLSNVHTVKELNLPSQTLAADKLIAQYPHLSNLPLKSYQNVSPRLLIGMDHHGLGRPLKSHEGQYDQPVAAKTRLGWTVYGAINENGTSFVQTVGRHNYHTCAHDTDEIVQQMVKQYFSLDSMGIKLEGKRLLSTEDHRAEKMLQAITILKHDRYQTGLLWKYDQIRLPDSLPFAKRRQACLERRMVRDPALAAALEDKIKDYLSKGYAKRLTSLELQQTRERIWYLPIFPVSNPNKPGKIRIVWDAAAKVHGISLNSVLMTGPDQLNSLLSILLKFRENKIAVCGDIRDMFHQVYIESNDQHCQRFLWKDDVYVMQRMTFGATCSPGCAQFIKNTNAKRFESTFPRAVDAILNKHYVDEMLASVETEDEAIQLAREVKAIHAKGGFEMRGWISNSTRVVAALSEEGTKNKNLDIASELTIEKVLGLWWCTTSDTFTFKIAMGNDLSLLNGTRIPTKRDVLRVLMRIFDPLGLLANFLFYLKVLLQDVWRAKIGWDDHIKGQLITKWQTWLKILPSIENVQVTRAYSISFNLSNARIQLHTFVDASEAGYAAVSYLRIEKHQQVECVLVGAKTRVAPLKYVSIPRLELQAAVLGNRFAKTIIQSVPPNTKLSLLDRLSRRLLLVEVRSSKI